MSQPIPFFISIPHSGEKIPDQTPWLKSLDEKVLMSDVDRFVDVLYEPALKDMLIPFEKTIWHRYAVDLNRLPIDVDQSSVVGAELKAGTHPDGYHWVMTKNEQTLMSKPMSQETHKELTKLIFEPFHLKVKELYESFKKNGAEHVFHIDAHSMPSLGTRMHKDPGELRADIVVSDCAGKSCHPKFKDLVIAAYATAGFKVGYNWPYLGGRVTQQYGNPKLGQQAIQVELNRALYMDEKTKQIKDQHLDVQEKIKRALKYIKSELPKLNLSE